MASVAIAAGPAPVAVQEVKAFLRIGNSDEDALIAGLIRSAQGACEAFAGLVLIERAFAERIDADATWRRLAAAPVRSITSVALVDAGGAETALAADAYAIDVDARGDGWVRLTGARGRALVRYAAGLAADWNGVPEPLRHGIVRLAAHLYLERGAAPAVPPAAVAALWRPWRRLRVG